jgi:phosphoribosylformylglycinamidine cyclo-ligase
VLLNSGMSHQGDASAASGVDTGAASDALSGLILALSGIDPGRRKRSLVPSGHYAGVLDIDGRTGVALCTDGVGTKLIVAEQAGRFDTVGIDCVAMCANDLICVGAEPLALVDYIAVEQVDATMLSSLGEGLRVGAERAGVEIPGGELAELPEMLVGHPSPGGFDLVGAAIGIVKLDRLVLGDRIAADDVIIGLPSSGIHSNGFTLARRVLREAGFVLENAPERVGRPLADELLEPTEIYVRAVLDLLRSKVDVRGLAHITGDGLTNLLRLNDSVGHEIDDPLPPQPIFELIAEAGSIKVAEMYRVFNMGMGFCCIVAPDDERPALDVLRRHYPAARRVGNVTPKAGKIDFPS